MKHRGLVYTFASRFCAKFPREDFDETVSTGFMTLMKCAKGFKPEYGFTPSTYIVRALRTNWYRDRGRRLDKEKRQTSLNANLANDRGTTWDIADQHDPTDPMIRDYERKAFAQEIEHMREEHPEMMRALTMRAHGMTLVEVAKEFGVSRTTIQNYERSLLEGRTFAEAISQ